MIESYDLSGWESLDIYLFTNGQEQSPPRKYHLTTEQLESWDATLQNLAALHYGSQNKCVEIYTLDGHQIESPMQLKNGGSYVAVEHDDIFVPVDYKKYLMRASRSWEKSQANKNSKDGCKDICAVQSKNEKLEINPISSGSKEYEDCKPGKIKRITSHTNLHKITKVKSLKGVSKKYKSTSEPKMKKYRNDIFGTVNSPTNLKLNTIPTSNVTQKPYKIVSREKIRNIKSNNLKEYKSKNAVIDKNKIYTKNTIKNTYDYNKCPIKCKNEVLTTDGIKQIAENHQKRNTIKTLHDFISKDQRKSGDNNNSMKITPTNNYIKKENCPKATKGLEIFSNIKNYNQKPNSNILDNNQQFLDDRDKSGLHTANVFNEKNDLINKNTKKENLTNLQISNDEIFNQRNDTKLKKSCVTETTDINDNNLNPNDYAKATVPPNHEINEIKREVTKSVADKSVQYEITEENISIKNTETQSFSKNNQLNAVLRRGDSISLQLNHKGDSIEGVLIIENENTSIPNTIELPNIDKNMQTNVNLVLDHNEILNINNSKIFGTIVEENQTSSNKFINNEDRQRNYSLNSDSNHLPFSNQNVSTQTEWANILVIPTLNENNELTLTLPPLELVKNIF